MNKINKYLSANKTKVQNIIFLTLMIFPLLMWIGASAGISSLIYVGLAFVILANLLSILNK